LAGKVLVWRGEAVLGWRSALAGKVDGLESRGGVGWRSALAGKVEVASAGKVMVWRTAAVRVDTARRLARLSTDEMTLVGAVLGVDPIPRTSC
jgi:hypothetical protein